jgi:pimeloyl-ACP methyl ester carboxylesterase
VADILAVLDATGTDRAIVVAHCHANWWAVELADAHPDRVQALVSIEPGVPYLGRSHDHWRTASATFDEVLDEPVGWQLYNRHVIINEPRRWLEFFFTQQLPEPHSSKQLEDMVRWGLDSTGQVLVAGELGAEIDPPDHEDFRVTCRRLQMPVLVIHGDRDPCQPVERGRAFAEITGGDLLVIEGAGHLTPAREPVKVNLALRGFIERLAA